MKKTLTLAIIGLALSGCAGSSHVLTVDGVAFDFDDIPISTEEPSIGLDIFRNTLNWVVANQVLTAAAGEEFGIALSEQTVLAAAQAGLGAQDSSDPRANLDFFRIQARVGPQGALWGELAPLLADDLPPIEWARSQLREADVEVASRYGEWRVTPEPGVYGP